MYDSLASTAVPCLSYDDDGRSTNRPTDRRSAAQIISGHREIPKCRGFISISFHSSPSLPRRKNSILSRDKRQTACRVPPNNVNC